MCCLTSTAASLFKRKFIKPRGSQQTYLLLHGCNNGSRKVDAWTRNEVHRSITETPKRGVTSRDDPNIRNPERTLEILRRNRKSVSKPKKNRIIINQTC